MALHREALAEHGGLDGLRDAGLLDSALARCMHRAMYDSEASVHHLAAALAFGLARNHPFHDGNKRIARIALIASFLFIELNGWKMTATESAAYGAIFGVAEGSIAEPALAQWFAEHSSRARAR